MATNNGQERGNRIVGCIVMLSSFAGWVLIDVGVGLTQPQTPRTEVGYVCGDAPPEPSEIRHGAACYRAHDGSGRGADVPTGPLCPLAGSPYAYCYEGLAGEEPSTAYLWFDCTDMTLNFSRGWNCTAGQWRMGAEMVNKSSTENVWYQKADIGLTGEGGWEYRNEDTEEWGEAPDVWVSACDEYGAIDNETGLPDACFAERITSYKNPPMAVAGFVLFLLPFILYGLGCALAVVGAMVMGCFVALKRPGCLICSTGISIALVSGAALASIVDICVGGCYEMFALLIFSLAWVCILVALVSAVADVVKMACVRRWGSVVDAVVDAAERVHSGEDNDGRPQHQHFVTVSFEMPQQASYQWVSASDDTSDESIAPPVLSVGNPVDPNVTGQPDAEKHTGVDTKRVRKRVAVSSGVYRRTSIGSTLEVSVLSRPTEVVMATSDTKDCCGGVVVVVAFIVFAAAFSFPGVVLPLQIFFSDELEYCDNKCDDGSCCDPCNAWHVKASYITLASFPAIFYAITSLASFLAVERRGREALGEQELPTRRRRRRGMRGRHTNDAHTEATEQSSVTTDDLSDLHLAEEDVHSIT